MTPTVTWSRGGARITHRLGFAVQLGTVRALGRFLDDPLDLPWAAVDMLAGQLDIGDASGVKKYVQRPQTAYEHAWEIRTRYGYRPFEDAEVAGRFGRFLAGRAWTHAEGPVALFDQSVAWLRRNRVLLPGVSVLARQVSAAREAAETRLHAELAAAAQRVDPGLAARLAALLQVPEGAGLSELERLRRSPRRSSGPEMVKAMQRAEQIAALARQAIALDAAWKQTAARLAAAGEDARVRVVTGTDGRARLHVEHLDALDERASLARLRDTAQVMLPRVDLPELLLEVHAWTGFLDAYTHLADSVTRTKDLAISVAALLVAEACNVGLTPVIKPGEPALTRARLAHVDQYYVRADNHAAANAVLIDAQAAIPIAQTWGGGLLASVDGLRFVVPVRTINAGPSPRYFGYKRGITWLNAVNDQVAGIGQIVVPGTPRDSLHILDALINLDAGPKPEVVTTDNASYSDMVFGLFALLGYRFSPGFADMPDQRYWRAPLPDRLPDGVELSGEQAAIDGYGPLEPIARNNINLTKIAAQWPDMLRVAGSLVTNQVHSTASRARCRMRATSSTNSQTVACASTSAARCTTRSAGCCSRRSR